eukprot:4651679-Prymnesium_polylepis.1
MSIVRSDTALIMGLWGLIAGIKGGLMVRDGNCLLRTCAGVMPPSAPSVNRPRASQHTCKTAFKVESAK